MPIPFTCSCGKLMKARDDFAGRKVKCPQCSQVVRIPTVQPKIAMLPPVPTYSRVATTASLPLPVRSLARPASKAPHAWVDLSLIGQQPTAWLPGDQARLQTAPGFAWKNLGLAGVCCGGLAILTWVLLVFR